MWVGLLVLLGIFSVCYGWPIVREWYKHTFSSRWPKAPGKFERGGVADVVKSAGDVMYDAYRLTAFFSYRVGDQTYEGEYTEDFRSLSDARQILRSRKNGPLYVRYDPAKPWDSVLNPYRDLKP